MQNLNELTTLIDYYGAKMSRKQIDIYLEALADISPDQLHNGVIEIINTATFFPKVAEIRRAVKTANERITHEQAARWHELLDLNCNRGEPFERGDG